MRTSSWSSAENCRSGDLMATARAPMMAVPDGIGATMAERRPNARALVGSSAGPNRRCCGSLSASMTRNSPATARRSGWSSVGGTRVRRRDVISPGPEATRQMSPSWPWRAISQPSATAGHRTRIKASATSVTSFAAARAVAARASTSERT